MTLRRLALAGGALLLAFGVLGSVGATPPAEAPEAPGADELPATAPTSFVAGLEAYTRGDFATARRVFSALAALGDAASMYNLGVMSLKGEGTTGDRGSAVGWWKAAAEAGHAPAGPLVERFEPTLDDGGRAARDNVLGVYGQAALRESVLPGEAAAPCREAAITAWPRRADGERPRFPRGVWRPGFDGFVLLDFRVGADGRTSDPRLVVAIPARGPDARAFVAASKQALLKSRWTPALAGGTAVATRQRARFRYHDPSVRGQVMDMPMFHRLRGLVDRGSPEAGYVLGTAASLDRTLGIAPDAARRMVLLAAQAGVPEAQFALATQTRSADPRCPRPAKSAAWLEAAATSGLPEARVALALERLHGQHPPVAQIREWLVEAAAVVEAAHVQRDVLAVLAAAADPGLRDAAAAAALAHRYSPGETGDPQDDEVIAAVAAAQGNYRAAAARQRDALSAARRLGWNTSVMQERLAAYEAGQPWHGDLLAPPPPAP